MASLLSPFLAALPVPHHVFFEYDADGDAIMMDAETGLPVRYGLPPLDSDSAQSEDRSTPPPPLSRPCPGAPKKTPRAPSEDEKEEDDMAGFSLRDLANRIAEAALEPPVAENLYAPTGGEPFSYGDSSSEYEVVEDEWCTSVVVPDLALRLDMRHPRVILNFLRFVHTYNELAPEGEEINIPLIDSYSLAHIVDHPAVKNPPAEFADEVLELRSLLDKYAKW